MSRSPLSCAARRIEPITKFRRRFREGPLRRSFFFAGSRYWRFRPGAVRKPGPIVSPRYKRLFEQSAGDA
ncbi:MULTISPECIES: hemopexin repeat-containing protein [Paracoccus]|uniref:hemopexin repeat-containing protein n=1 Tax=Paracoccus TaxID=265 RepID=UPI000DF7F466|nr:hypothetical protein DVR11_23020 [Paracoccus versutus]WGR56139.1 hypothetical protein E3U25_09270 [Paracoccus versutus]